MSQKQVEDLLEGALTELLEARARRVRPGLDDKILTAWNALMIRGLAIAGRHLGEPGLVDAALRAIDFLRENAWIDGRLFAVWKAGVARFPGYLDDHAFLLDGLLEALQSRFRLADLDFARQVADALLANFEDRERGGFWFTAAGADTPLYRPKGFADDSMASGNGVAAQALMRLGWLLGETGYLEAAERALRAGFAPMQRAPEGHAAMLNALDEYLEPVEIVTLRGDAGGLAEWQARLAREYAPRRMVLAIPSHVAGLPDALATKSPRAGTVAYVCRGPACSEPVTRLDALSASRP